MVTYLLFVVQPSAYSARSAIAAVHLNLRLDKCLYIGSHDLIYYHVYL